MKKMIQINDDSTLTELCKGFVYSALGRSSTEQALYAFEELGAKFGRSVLLLSNIAACQLALGNLGEAERCIEEAMEIGEANSDLYINAIVCSELQGKSSDQYLDLLKKSNPQHAWLVMRSKLERAFEAGQKSMSK